MKKTRFSVRLLAMLLVLGIIFPLVPAAAKADDGIIVVTFALQGCSKHGDNGEVHTRADGGLRTWISTTSYALPEDSTVLDLLEAASKDKGFSYTNKGNYISTIRGLSEFDNGPRSGWLYRLNGSYPDLGVEEQKLKDGDRVVFHYTDDYLIEYAGGTPETTPPVTTPAPTTPPVTTPAPTTPPSAETPPEDIGSTASWSEFHQIIGDGLVEKSLTFGNEWIVIGLARSGYAVDGGYYENALAYIRENLDETGRLHKVKSTDNSRLILALTAIGKDASQVEGRSLIDGLSSLEYIQKQGINGPVFALLALDSGNYPTPYGSDVTREALVQTILDAQLPDGGWNLSAETADSDMTAMALQALAPYCRNSDRVKQAADKAVDCLSKLQNADGGFSTGGGATSESVSQVIVALTALGLDPHTDEGFVKNGRSAVDALLAYYTDGGFRHVAGGEKNGIATEQGYYALAAYARFLNGETALYDMTDILDKGGDATEPTQPDVSEPTETAPSVTEPATADDDKGGFPWWVIIVIGAACMVAVPILYKKK